MEDPVLGAEKHALDIKPSKRAAKAFFMLALIYILASLFIYGFAPRLQSFAFLMLGDLRMLPPFADLRWVTSISECGISLGDLGQGKVATCDPWNRGGLGYPPLSVEVARFLHVEEAHTEFLGFAIGLATIVILLSLLFQLMRPGWRRDLTGGLLIISFPVQLALERSNIDIVVFILLASLATALAASKRWLLPFVGGLSWLAVVIKMYPVAGITAWLGLTVFRRPRFDIVRSVSLLGTSIGFAMVLPWFLNYRGVAAQPPAGPISHGFIVPLPFDFLEHRVPLIGYIFQAIPQPLISAAIFVIVLGWSMHVHLADQWEAQLSQKTDIYRRRVLYIIPSLLGCVWLGCYFLSSSFDYRLILALPAFIVILGLLDSPDRENNRSSRALLWTVTLSGFTCFMLPLLSFNAFTISSDLFIMPVVAAAISALFLPPRASRNY